MTTPIALEIEGLYLSYGQREVLHDLHLEVQEGEFMGLAGPNGCGKTTLLNAVSGSLTSKAGRILFRGRELNGLSPKERARLVAVVPQNPTVPPGFTVEGVVLMGRNPHLGLLQWEGPRDMEVVLRALEMTDTLEFAGRLLTSLSGGEGQRVFIARALTQEAPLLLLDEPTAHLDIGYQTAVLDLVERIRQRTGVTVLAAMHDLTLAAQYCQRIALMHQGKILSCGPPSQVLSPELIHKAFGTRVYLMDHPVHHTPVVLPASDGRGHQPEERADQHEEPQ